MRFLILLLVCLLCSCKKDFVCECRIYHFNDPIPEVQTIEIYNKTKIKADKECDGHQHDWDGKPDLPNVNCELK